MIAHYLSRLFYYVSIFIGIILFSFILFHIIPSDPARIILGPNAEQMQVLQLREQLGLNDPLYMQFANYLNGIIRFDFGLSYVDNRNVLLEVYSKLQITLLLVGLSLFITVMYLSTALFAFIVPGMRRILSALEFVMSSLPIFFSGVIISLLVVYYYPVIYYSGTIWSWSNILYLIPPAAVLSFYPMAIMSGILRNELFSIIQSPFILAAKSYGFSDAIILFRYAIRNALIPVLSALSNILPFLIAGAFIVEVIFTVPGMGSLLIKSILERDFPMLECLVIINGAFFVLVNLGFEYLYPIIDPRIARR